MIDCTFCGGTGTVFNPRAASCSVCHGHGKLPGSNEKATYIHDEMTVETFSTLPVECESAVKALLRSSWADISNEYEMMTTHEKACLTKEQHAILVKWISG